MVCISAPRTILRCIGQAYLMSFLEEHDLSAKWVKMVGKGVVRVTAFDGNVPLADFVWFVCRHSHAEGLTAVLKKMLADIGAAFTANLEACASQEPPSCNLPTECQVPEIKLALRGDDKRALMVSGFLKRNSGLGAVETLLIKELAYSNSFRSFRDDSLHALSGAYFTAARELHDQACRANRAMSGDFLMGDCSRVASQEVLLLHLCSNGVFAQAPLRVMPDSSIGSGADVASVCGELVTAQDRKKRCRSHDKTYWTLLSYIHAILFMLPFTSLRPWLPDEPRLGGHDVTRHTHGGTGHAFWSKTSDGTSQWCLPAALRSEDCEHMVRTLTLVCDEGSEGWALFNFLANGLRARTIFIRDPPHRLSNLFTNAIRADVNILASTMQITIVHKFRRAPYGGGKMWKGLKEVLEVFLRQASEDHPLLQRFGPSIADDHGGGEGRDVRSLAKFMLTLPLGPKVQLRRWYTLYDAGRTLSKIWHTMLLALFVWYYALGEDPEKIMASRKEVHTAGGEEGDTNYEIRVQTLLALHSTFHVRIMRSMLICFERIWTHHKDYTATCYAPADTLRFQQLWADGPRWLREFVRPAMLDCFFRKGVWLRLSLLTAIEQVSAPLLGEEVGADVDDEVGEDEDDAFFRTHVRMGFNMLCQMLLYGLLPRSPPWLFCLLLVPLHAPSVLAFLNRMWQVILELQSSYDPAHQELLKAMTFLKWTVVQEVMELLVLAEWKLDTEAGRCVLSYVTAMFNSGLLTTLSLENGFNDLRDNEARGARHQQRAPDTLQSLSISSLHSRYATHTHLWCQ